MTVYIDVLFLINIVADYLLLLVTAKICAVFVPRRRLALAALFGAAYAVAAAVPGLELLANLFMKLAAGGLMLLIAFGGADRLLRLALVFMGVSAGFAGAVLAVTLLGGQDAIAGLLSSPTVFVLLSVFICSYIVCSLAFRRAARAEGGISAIELGLGEKRVKLHALCDTGNSLSDPLTGKRILITDFRQLSELFPAAAGAAIEAGRGLDPVTLVERLNRAGCGCRFRLVPYRAVGVESGMLPAFSPDSVVIDGVRRDSYLVALSPNRVGDGGPYSAIINAA